MLRGESFKRGEERIARQAALVARFHLAVHARQLAFQPRLRNLRRHHRGGVRGVEQTHRIARHDHVNWNARLGARGSMQMTVGMS